MKSRVIFFATILVAIFSSQISNAQMGIWDIHLGGAANTTNGISRWGNVGIGVTASYIPAYPLHIISSNTTGIKLVNSNGGAGSNMGVDFITYNPTTSHDHRTARIAAIDGGSYNASLAFYTRGTSGGSGNDISERMRIQHDGKVGIGTATPGKLLHLRSNGPSLFLDLSSSGFAKVEFGSTTTAYEISYASIPAPGNRQLKIGHTNTLYKSMYFRNDNGSNSSIIFSHNYQFGETGNTGLTGTYLFDAQVSATSMMVAPAAASGSYPSIPAGGYLFNVQGDSYLKGKTYQDGLLQINNATDLDPNNANLGLSVGNSINTIAANPPTVLGEIPYTWLQSQESRPLALNPVPNTNPGSSNTSYVAVGFVPGNYNVPVGYKLAVKGKIICEELKVKYAGQWSDYVFEKDYKLRNLKEVEQYITENKHLPDVPSATEIKEEGIEAGQMDATLLRKIEELTLYMIKQEKRIEELENQLKNKDNK